MNYDPSGQHGIAPHSKCYPIRKYATCNKITLGDIKHHVLDLC